MTEHIDDIEAPTEKTFVRSVRITPSAWAEVQARAERAGMLVNSYVVWAISRAPERSDIRDDGAALALSDGQAAVSVGSAADVHDAAQAVVIDDDGDALLAMAEAGADAAFDLTKTPVAVQVPGSATWEKIQVEAWPGCGHPKTEENTQKRGKGRPGACRICRRETDRASYARLAAKRSQTANG